MRACLVALLVAGCGSSASPSTLPTNTGEARAPTATDPEALVDALLGEAPAAAWSPTEQRAIFPMTYSEEGTGSGLTVTIIEPGKESGDLIEVYVPTDEDPEEAARRARPGLVERVTGKGFVLMAYTAWPDGAPSVKLPTGVELTWKDTELFANGKELVSIEPEDPHQPRPKGVFSLAGTRTIVFTYHMDPGEAYLEGFNAFADARVLSL